MEIRANLGRQGSFAVLRREDEMDIDFGEGLSHGAGDSSTCLRICQAGALAAFQAAPRWCPLTQGIGLRPQPWARFSRPVGPATGFVRRSYGVLDAQRVLEFLFRARWDEGLRFGA